MAKYCENWLGSSGFVNTECGTVQRGNTRLADRCPSCGKATGIKKGNKTKHKYIEKSYCIGKGAAI